MANSFYRSHWNPIRNGYYPQAQVQPESTKPKVISIPVHFVGSDNATGKKTPAPAPATTADTAMPTGEARVAAAVTIQRAVRGFLVRKNVRVVRQIAGEVEEIERKVREEEAKIRLDARQRLLVSETLMALLLRLDTVRGVRDFRKRVIRRVIRLQEMIDLFSAAAVDGPITLSEESSIDLEKTTDQTLHLDEMEEEKTALAMEMSETVESPKISCDTIATVDGTISTSCADQNLDVEEETHEADTELEMKILAEAESSERQSDLIEAAGGTISSRSLEDDQKSFVESAEESLINHEKIADQTLDLELLRRNENGADLEVNSPDTLESPKRKSDLIDIDLAQDGSRSSELEEEIPKANEEGASLVVESREEMEAKREDEMRMREMVERVALENERLKEMVAQLCSTSSKQCQLMEGLADRMEHLERLVHHRMDRRKKRRSIAACSALSSAKSRWRMANPFYRSHWNPIRYGYYPQAQIQPESTKPKVISIPVYFVGSDNATEKKTPAPATTANTIAGEVEEIERKVREEEAKIRLDARQRLLVSETLMALLLRLDTVRGVRDFRKRVIRRVIRLQEMIDLLSAAAVDGPITLSEESSIDLEKTTDQNLHLDEMEEEKTALAMEMSETVESPKISCDTVATVDGTISTSCADQNLDVEEETHEADTELEMKILAEAESSERQSDLIEAADGTISSRSLEDDHKSFVELAEESLINHEKIADQTLDLELLRRNENDGSRSSELEEETPKANEEGASLVVESMEEMEAKREDEMREMVERVALENDRLKEMVAQLCSTSSKQCQLMEGLADRMEHLERLVHHRMDRRKKRRSIATCSALSSAK
ncbi:hypothetical protein IEQ34_020994 [Dendrobium chrysotoxum]|uniref:BAG domain-containing protein n=1 Tax=Dendrobium chrysotoxum TaxID=161865 RepID=A0AAV7G4A3_DENCH|nr:hypothetical protein IEQ34_020994 [Dendrobium chrysotoxum]